MVKDQVLAKQIYDSIDLTIEAANELLKNAVKGELEKYNEIANLLFTLLNKINNNSRPLIIEEDGIMTDKSVVSITDSLQRINGLMSIDREYALKKLEYELIPLTEECRINFYYWAMVNGDKEKEKKYLEEDMFTLADNNYVRNSIETGIWKYDLSIVVTGYNKLEYTRKCIENLLKYYPRWLRTELILLNHGSDDGTKEFFESVNPDKQIDIKINGGGCNSVYRIVEGRRILFISNDVFIQYNTIKNLYDCMNQDDKISYTVPSTPNVSNLQTIDLNYSSEDELEILLKSNNCNNNLFREQRTRLCNPLCMVDSEFIYRYKPLYRFFAKNLQSFPDDNLSLLCRRNGFKMFLVKDAYCYHCGSVTLKDETVGDFYTIGRNDFKKRYGIDPWYKCAYSPYLISKLLIENKSNVSILSVDGGQGANALKLKEEIRYNYPNTKIYLKYLLTDDLYLSDVSGIGDESGLINNYNDLVNEQTKYDYIIIEEIDNYHLIKDQMLEIGRKIINVNGTLVLEINSADVSEIDESLESIEENNKTWLFYRF